MSNLIPCLGGFCQSRDHCLNYLSESVGNPVERMCGKEEKPELTRGYPESIINQLEKENV